MIELEATRRATVHDVAREAGVSLATVDRVLNGRPGVRPLTAEKVERAIAALHFRRDLSASLLARARDLRVQFLIPGGSNEFMHSLAGAIARRGRVVAAERTHVASSLVKPLDARDLAQQINALNPKTCDCAVIVATEDKAVRAAVESATRRGIAIMTLVSDLPGSARRLFIGIDNFAAGRTAASLMGRFLPTGGKVGIVAGSLDLADHRQRLEGFRSVVEAEFAAVEIIGPVVAHDARDETEQVVGELLDAHPDLAGLYNLGAGNAGLIAALGDRRRPGQLRVIAHELSPPTIAGLGDGTIDVVLDQNPDGEIRAALAAARSLALGSSHNLVVEPIEIGIFLRDNLRQASGQQPPHQD